jgi:ketopantoate hydroxymethyltransferase
MGSFALSERLVYMTLLDGIRLAVGSGVVDEVVHVLTQELGVTLETQQRHARRICEGAVSVHVCPVYAFAGRVQQKCAQVFCACGVSRDHHSAIMTMIGLNRILTCIRHLCHPEITVVLGFDLQVFALRRRIV